MFDNPDIDVMPPLVKTRKSRRKQKQEKKNEEGTESDDDEEPMYSYKMVFVVNSALNMGVGKIASQVAHACLGVYRLLNEFQYMNEIVEEWEDEGYLFIFTVLLTLFTDFLNFLGRKRLS